MPLARLVPAGVDRRGMPTKARIVLFRRPLEARARDGADLADLVHHVLVDQVANYLAWTPTSSRASDLPRVPGMAVSRAKRTIAAWVSSRTPRSAVGCSTRTSAAAIGSETPTRWPHARTTGTGGRR